MATKNVLIIDTSILCVWLKVPGMDRCGSDNDPWDFQRIDKEITAHIDCDFTLVLPLASIIETGNHIAKANHSRRERATSLAEIMRKAADERTPWAAFRDQDELWSPDGLNRLAQQWPDLAAQKLAIGDATIKQVADYYTRMGLKVQLLTGDEQLKTYESMTPPSLQPRRRRL
jgi:hypothetical protein